MASSRLPGKVLMPLAGRPLLEVLYRRIASATHVDEIWFATGIDMENDPIEALGHSLGVPVYRGSDEDVLQRLVDACECADADIV
ncbi:MAG: spore coat protein, partial [Rhodospirillales bacterium]|nr:spore coat protein [Rhodospirillales bacterium]